MATPFTPARYQSEHVWTNFLQDDKGNKIETKELTVAVLKTWGDFDLPNAVNQDFLRAVPEYVGSGSNKIGTFRIEVENRIGIRDRKEIVNANRCGHVDAQPEVRSFVRITMDDELEVGPLITDSWDSIKLGQDLMGRITSHGSFTTEPARLRNKRFFEAARVSAKWAEVNKKPIDGIDRIVEISATATDQEIVRKIQDAIIALKEIEDEKGYASGLKNIGSRVVAVLSAKYITAISNAQGLGTTQGDVNQLAIGIVGFISGVPIYEAQGSEGLSYIMFRGAVAVPMSNFQWVKHPSDDNILNIGLQFAASTVKDNNLEKILPERVIALGTGAAAKVNAAVRPRPERSKLGDVNDDIAKVVDYLQSQTLSNKKYMDIAPKADSEVSLRHLGICPTYNGSDLRDADLSPVRITAVDKAKKQITVEVDVAKTGGTQKTAKWVISAADYQGIIVPTDQSMTPPDGKPAESQRASAVNLVDIQNILKKIEKLEKENEIQKATLKEYEKKFKPPAERQKKFVKTEETEEKESDVEVKEETKTETSNNTKEDEKLS